MFKSLKALLAALRKERQAVQFERKRRERKQAADVVLAGLGWQRTVITTRHSPGTRQRRRRIRERRRA